jgi:hypothetical protein
VVLEEFTTYQAILRKGCLAEARRYLLVITEDKLGRPCADVLAAINALEDEEQLEQLGQRVNKVNSWEALLAVPSRRGRYNRRGATT